MRLQTAQICACVATILALAGCGGGGTSDLGPGGGGSGGGGGGGGVDTSAVTFLSNTTADTTSQLGGTAISSIDNTVLRVSARLPHQRRDLVDFDNGLTVFTDDDEGDKEGLWTDGTSTLSPRSPNSIYDYARFYNFTTPDAAGGSGPTIIGVLTPISGLSNGGSVTYTGQAFIDGTGLATDKAFEATGLSKVIGNFDGSRTVDVVISGLTNSPPFTELTIIGMALDLNNSSFAGGDLKLFGGGSDVTADVMGTSVTSDAEGTFFGLAADASTEQPDEAGGVFVIDGTDGTISGGFLAD